MEYQLEMYLEIKNLVSNDPNFIKSIIMGIIINNTWLVYGYDPKINFQLS